jgi:hypothetical protein
MPSEALQGGLEIDAADGLMQRPTSPTATQMNRNFENIKVGKNSWQSPVFTDKH